MQLRFGFASTVNENREGRFSATSAFALAAVLLLFSVGNTFGRPGKIEPNHQLIRVSQQFEHQKLAKIFLTNQGNLDKRNQELTNQTGVAHYLAISAGQIGPLIAVVLAIATKLIVSFRKAEKTKLTRKKSSVFGLFRARTAIALASCFTLCALYGFTGSLMRVVVFLFFFDSLCKTFSHLRKLSVPTPKAHLFQFVALALLIAFAGRNLIHDWSFLYAATGAACCQLAVSLCSKGIQTAGLLKRSLVALFFSQLLCSFVMLPVHAANPAAAIPANLVLLPLVTFIIVPATVALTLLVESGFLLDGALNEVFLLLIQVADHAFSIFVKAISFFGALKPFTAPIFVPFSEQTKVYFLGVITLGLVMKIYGKANSSTISQSP